MRMHICINVDTPQSADNLCKYFELRKDRQNIGPDLDPNHLTLKEFFEKVDFEKISRQAELNMCFQYRNEE